MQFTGLTIMLHFYSCPVFYFLPLQINYSLAKETHLFAFE